MYESVPITQIARPKGLVGGPFGSSLGSKDYEVVGVPVIRGTNLGNGKYVGGDFVFVSPDKVARDLSRNTAIQGDVLFTQRGTLGQVALIRTDNAEEFVVSQSQMRLRVDPEIASADYVYYACSTSAFLKQIFDNAISTGVPHINLGILGRLSIPLPAVPVQRAIAEVLGALDDKIAANTKLSESANALVTALFQRSRAGQEHRATISEVMTLEYGKPLLADVRIDGHVDVFGSGGIVGSHDTALRHGPGIVVGRKGTAGAVHWASRDYYPIDTTYFVQPLRPTDFGMAFCYQLLRAAGLSERNSDSAVPGLNRNDAYAVKVSLPTVDIARSFESDATPLMLLASHAESESSVLRATRDALLPPLMSGKLRVRDFDKTLETEL